MNFIDRIRFWIYRQEERRKHFEIQDRINAKERKEEYKKGFQEWKEVEKKTVVTKAVVVDEKFLAKHLTSKEAKKKNE